ncbi:HAMP domain-containing protein [Neomoorella mulderi]
MNVTVTCHFNDEIGRLADTLNHMTQELQRLDRLKSEFVSSISQ